MAAASWRRKSGKYVFSGRSHSTFFSSTAIAATVAVNDFVADAMEKSVSGVTLSFVSRSRTP